MRLSKTDINNIIKYIIMLVAFSGLPASIKYVLSGVWIIQVVIPLIIFILIGNYLVKHHGFTWGKGQ